MNSRLFTFIGGDKGVWRVTSMETIVGDPLPGAARLEIVSGAALHEPHVAGWVLHGITSNERYVVRDEKDQLIAKQAGLDRIEATCAALIPIRKNASWWSLSQGERRKVFEEQSGHIKVGLQYLPAIARRLHHCRDLGENEPFDFLTWFEFTPSDEAAFNKLVAEFRSSPEWAYVDREIDIRLVRGTA